MSPPSPEHSSNLEFLPSLLTFQALGDDGLPVCGLAHWCQNMGAWCLFWVFAQGRKGWRVSQATLLPTRPGHFSTVTALGFHKNRSLFHPPCARSLPWLLLPRNPHWLLGSWSSSSTRWALPLPLSRTASKGSTGQPLHSFSFCPDFSTGAASRHPDKAALSPIWPDAALCNCALPSTCSPAAVPDPTAGAAHCKTSQAEWGIRNAKLGYISGLGRWRARYIL